MPSGQIPDDSVISGRIGSRRIPSSCPPCAAIRSDRRTCASGVSTIQKAREPTMPSLARRLAAYAGALPGFHLMEQPIDGTCSAVAEPPAATAFIASTRSRGAPGFGLMPPSDRRPR